MTIIFNNKVNKINFRFNKNLSKRAHSRYKGMLKFLKKILENYLEMINNLISIKYFITNLKTFYVNKTCPNKNLHISYLFWKEREEFYC